MKTFLSSAAVTLRVSMYAFTVSSHAVTLVNNGSPDNLSGRNMTAFRVADDFALAAPGTVVSLRFWWSPGNGNPVTDFNGTITYAFYANNAGSLGSLIATGTVANLVSIPTGATTPICNIAPHCPVHSVDFVLTTPVTLSAGTYWLELHEGTALTSNDGTRTVWVTAAQAGNAKQDLVPTLPATGVNQELAFQLFGPSQNFLVNPRFDGSLAGWTLQSGSAFAAFDSTRNASGALSGSAKSVNNVDQSSNPFCTGVNICVSVIPVSQCLAVNPGTRYAFSGKIFIPSGQSSSGDGAVGLNFWDHANCGGNFLGNAGGNVVSSRGKWTLSSGVVQAPPGAVSARLYTANQRIERTGSLQVNFDDMSVRETQDTDCAILDPGLQIPVKATGFANNFRNGTVTLGFSGTNMGITPVLNPFVQTLLWEFITIGAPVTVSPTTTCFGSNAMPYAPLADILKPGETGQGVMVFNAPPGLRLLRVDFNPHALSGLE